MPNGQNILPRFDSTLLSWDSTDLTFKVNEVRYRLELGNCRREFNKGQELIRFDSSEITFDMDIEFTDKGPSSKAWRGIGTYFENGMKGFRRLQLYELGSNKGLSVTKPNIEGEEGYIPPTEQ